MHKCRLSLIIFSLLSCWIIIHPFSYHLNIKLKKRILFWMLFQIDIFIISMNLRVVSKASIIILTYCICRSYSGYWWSVKCYIRRSYLSNSQLSTITSCNTFTIMILYNKILKTLNIFLEFHNYKIHLRIRKSKIILQIKSHVRE